MTFEDVLNVIEFETANYFLGVILQFGGQTAVNLAMPLEKARIPILGTSPFSMDIAEDRRKFSGLLKELKILETPSATGYSFVEVKELADKIGYPVLVRPSYVIGGRAMEIVYNERELEKYMKVAAKISKEYPILVDKFLTEATEVDVDAISDGRDVFIAGIMEHIEEAGVHSGDSFMVIPPQTLSPDVQNKIKEHTRKIALSLKVKGLLNIQFAVKDERLYVLEANPRASRTIPYVSKTIGIPLAKIATKIMLGKTLEELELNTQYSMLNSQYISIKASVFPFLKLPGVDPLLGPEMKSTGEVMAVDQDFGMAYYKSIIATQEAFYTQGTVYLTVRDEDKPQLVLIAKEFYKLGFHILATLGTAEFLRNAGIPAETVYRISERKSPNALDLLKKGKINLIINTPSDATGTRRDGYTMRRLAVDLKIPFITALNSARAELRAIEKARTSVINVHSLNEFNKKI